MKDSAPGNRTLITIFAGSLVLVAMALAVLPAEGRPVGSAPDTWPTKTPTSIVASTDTPAAATATPGGGGGGGGATPSPLPPGTTPLPSTVPAGATTPSGGGGALASTPVGGYLATAEACGLPPTVRALGDVNVRSGPDTSYERIAGLVFLEVRPIIGRYVAGPWWLIALPDGTSGWVANQAVIVDGNTSPIPAVLPDGMLPEEVTASPTWQPTTDANCPVLPTYTPTTAASSTPSPSPRSSRVAPTASATAGATMTAAATVMPTSLPTAAPSPATSTPVPAADAPERAAAEGTNLILYAGLGLVLLGAGSLVIRRRH